MASTLTGAEAIGVFVAVIVVLAAVIYLPAVIAPPREKPASSGAAGSGGGGWGGSSEHFGGPDPGVRAAPRVAPPAIALPIAGSQNWCGNPVTPQRESRTASGPVHEIALEFSDEW